MPFSLITAVACHLGLTMCPNDLTIGSLPPTTAAVTLTIISLLPRLISPSCRMVDASFAPPLPSSGFGWAHPVRLGLRRF